MSAVGSDTARRPVPRPGMGWASAAFVLGAVFAAISAYRGLGGTALLDTVGGELARAGRSGSATLLAVLWLTVLIKLTCPGSS